MTSRRISRDHCHEITRDSSPKEFRLRQYSKGVSAKKAFA